MWSARLTVRCVSIIYLLSHILFVLYFQVSLTPIAQWFRSSTLKEKVVSDICATDIGLIAARMGHGSDQIHMCDRTGKTITRYTNLCTCDANKYISELIAGKYVAASCSASHCNNVKVVDTWTHEVVRTYSGRDIGHDLYAMCTAGEGSLLIWDDKSKSVIQLKWDEENKVLYKIRQVHVPGNTVWNMCYMPHADLVILRRPSPNEVQAVKLKEGAHQLPVWQLKGKVLGKWIEPRGVSSDSEGRVYVADGKNGRVLLLNGHKGQVIQELLHDDGLRWVDVSRVCCLSNPNQLLVHDGYTDDMKLYDVDTL